MYVHHAVSNKKNKGNTHASFIKTRMKTKTCLQMYVHHDVSQKHSFKTTRTTKPASLSKKNAHTEFSVDVLHRELYDPQNKCEQQHACKNTCLNLWNVFELLFFSEQSKLLHTHNRHMQSYKKAKWPWQTNPFWRYTWTPSDHRYLILGHILLPKGLSQQKPGAPTSKEMSDRGPTSWQWVLCSFWTGRSETNQTAERNGSTHHASHAATVLNMWKCCSPTWQWYDKLFQSQYLAHNYFTNLHSLHVINKWLLLVII